MQTHIPTKGDKDSQQRVRRGLPLKAATPFIMFNYKPLYYLYSYVTEKKSLNTIVK